MEVERIVIENSELFSPHITDIEYQVLLERIARLINQAKMPSPSEDWPPIPWPAY
jgi:hypothetical protein